MGCTNSKETKAKEEPKQQQQQQKAAAGDDRVETADNHEAQCNEDCAPVEVPLVEDVNVDDVDVEGADTEHAGAAPGDSRYKLGGPSQEGEVSDLWAPYAYKVVSDDGWWLYSDTNTYELTFTFKTRSDLEAGEGVETSKDGDRNVFTITLYPGETRRLWSGAPNGWAYSSKAQSLSAEYRARQAAAAEEAVSADVNAVQALKDANPDADADTLVALCLENDVKYVDLDFPPQQSSIGASMAPAAWQRPEQFLPPAERGKIRLIRDGVEPNDIDQGSLGDCWFLCAVASVAEDPEKIKDIFRHPKSGDRDLVLRERAAGAYRVTLNKGGWWHVLAVDSFLPCVAGAPCFAKNVQDPAELWVALLEKAYARMHGSYQAIAGGDARQALSDLTGYPTERFPDFNDREAALALFDRIVTYDEKGYMINLNTPGTDDSAYMGKSGAGNSAEFTARYKKAGLGMGHAYSVLVAKRFGDIKLVKIRNPWGNGTEWTGDWSDESSKWDERPDIKEACQLSAEGDGTFWMEWEDAITYFNSGGVCFVERDWHDYRVKGEFSNGVPSNIVELKVEQTTEIYFVLSQRDRRGLPSDHPDAKYHSVMISVASQDPDTGRYACKQNSNWQRIEEPQSGYGYCSGRDIAMKVTLEPSDAPYLIIPRAHPSCKAKKEFVLAMISSVKIGEGLSGRFTRPEEDWRCYQNYLRFEYDAQAVASVSTDFQYNPEVGVPKTFRADSLFSDDEPSLVANE